MKNKVIYLFLTYLTIAVGCSRLVPNEKATVELSEAGKKVKPTEDLHVLVGCRKLTEVEVTFDNAPDGVILLRNMAGKKGGEYLANPEFGQNPEGDKKYLAKADVYKC